jgi:hypothetical protein
MGCNSNYAGGRTLPPPQVRAALDGVMGQARATCRVATPRRSSRAAASCDSRIFSPTGRPDDKHDNVRRPG